MYMHVCVYTIHTDAENNHAPFSRSRIQGYDVTSLFIHVTAMAAPQAFAVSSFITPCRSNPTPLCAVNTAMLLYITSCKTAKINSTAWSRVLIGITDTRLTQK